MEAVEGLARRLAGRCRVVVAESPAVGSFREAVRRYGYERLADYGVGLLDLATRGSTCGTAGCGAACVRGSRGPC